MWEQYKKTLPVMQATILIATIIIYFAASRQWPVALFFFIVMQVGALAGAAWGARLKRKIKQRDDALPLERKRN